jgi:benzoyl-CoA reductase/2-hydroxyglutaryl-CoA dehydratase subunit BcrC/BadD/HgdB
MHMPASTSHALALDACPYIDLDDARCSSHFTLDHLAEAFDQCVGNYRACPNFYRLTKEQPRAVIGLTVHGRNLQSAG